MLKIIKITSFSSSFSKFHQNFIDLNFRRLPHFRSTKTTGWRTSAVHAKMVLNEIFFFKITTFCKFWQCFWRFFQMDRRFYAKIIKLQYFLLNFQKKIRSILLEICSPEVLQKNIFFWIFFFENLMDFFFRKIERKKHKFVAHHEMRFFDDIRVGLTQIVWQFLIFIEIIFIQNQFYFFEFSKHFVLGRADKGKDATSNDNQASGLEASTHG